MLLLPDNALDSLPREDHCREGTTAARGPLPREDDRCAMVWLTMLVLVCSSWCVCRCVEYDGSSRGLTAFPADIPTDVTILNLADNQLTNITSSDLSSFTALTDINLANNDISVMARDAMVNNPVVTTLSVSGNALNDLPTLVNNLITNLDASHNNITFIPSYIIYDSVEYLDLSYNDLDWTDGSIDGLATYGALRHLTLSGTKCSR